MNVEIGNFDDLMTLTSNVCSFAAWNLRVIKLDRVFGDWCNETYQKVSQVAFINTCHFHRLLHATFGFLLFYYFFSLKTLVGQFCEHSFCTWTEKVQEFRMHINLLLI